MLNSATYPLTADQREQSVRSKTPGSLERYQRSQRALAGGVSTALRRSARPYPLFFSHGKGSRITDVDGNTYLDYCLAWGPLLLGHAPPEVTAAVAAQLERGYTYGAQHELEYEVAELLQQIIPCGDLVCYANSGTEIVQVALRVARAATGRSRFLKFEGHYHGWDDSVLVSYHPTEQQMREAEDRPIPVGLGHRGSPDGVIARWNDRDSVERAFAKYAGQIASLICEPMLCNSGCIPPEPGFLEFLREITSQNGTLLIFDEVITGFRLDLRGGQGYYNVTPDLATFAKAAGGGLPLSVLAGKQAFMQYIAEGKAIHAGTLNGNPIALAAARAALQILSRDEGAVYKQLWSRGERLRSGLEEIFRKRNIPVTTSGGGPVFQLSFMDKPARHYGDTLKADMKRYSDFGLALLDEGVMALPDGRWYTSTAHSESDIDATLAAAVRAASSVI
jgi:glutamate-1-semialdehyde 2,1-aminomutase